MECIQKVIISNQAHIKVNFIKLENLLWDKLVFG